MVHIGLGQRKFCVVLISESSCTVPETVYRYTMLLMNRDGVVGKEFEGLSGVHGGASVPEKKRDRFSITPVVYKCIFVTGNECRDITEQNALQNGQIGKHITGKMLKLCLYKELKI